MPLSPIIKSLCFTAALIFVPTIEAWQLKIDNRLGHGLIQIISNPPGSTNPQHITIVVNGSTAQQFQIAQTAQGIFVNQVPVDMNWVSQLTHQQQTTQSAPGITTSPVLLPFPVMPTLPPQQMVAGGVVPYPAYQALQQQVAQMQLQGVGMTQQLAQLKQQLSHQTGMMPITSHQAELEEKQEAFDKELKAKEETISELNAKIDELNHRLETPPAPDSNFPVDEGPDTAVSVEEHEKVLAEKDQEIENKRKEIARLEADLKKQEEALQKEAKKSQGLLSHQKKLEEEKSRAEETSRDARKRETDEKQRADRAEKEQTKAQGELKTEQSKSGRLQQRVNQLEVERKELQARPTQEALDEKLKGQEEKVREAEQKLKTANAQVAQLQGELNKAQEEVSTAQQKLSELEDSLEEADQASNVEEWQEKVQALTKQLEDAKKAAEKQKDDKKKLQREMERNKTNYETKKNEQKQKHDEELRQQKESHKKEVKDLKEELEQQRQSKPKTKNAATSTHVKTKSQGMNTEDSGTSGGNAVPDKEVKTVTSEPVSAPVSVSDDSDVSSATMVSPGINSTPQGVVTGQATVPRPHSASPEVPSLPDSGRASESGSTDATTQTDPAPEKIETHEQKVGPDEIVLIDAQSQADLDIQELLNNLHTQGTLPDLLKSYLPKAPILVDASCGPGDPTDFTHEGKDFRSDKSDKGAEKTDSATNDEPSNQQDSSQNQQADAEPEDIGPSTIRGPLAAAFVEALGLLSSWVFPPVLLAVFGTGIYVGKVSKQAENNRLELEALKKNQSDSAVWSSSQPLSSSCDLLTGHPLKALCLEFQGDQTFAAILPLLINISQKHQETLYFPVFAWWQRSESTSRSLSAKELMDLLEASGDPSLVVSQLHLQSIKSNDFYGASLKLQKKTLMMIYQLWKAKGVSDEYIVWAPLSDDGFLLLLGAAYHAYSLEYKHAGLQAKLETLGIKELGKRLMDEVFEGEKAIELPASLGGGDEQSISIFQLGSVKPVMFRGISFRDGQTFDPGDKSRKIQCEVLTQTALQAACYAYLAWEIDWKARVLVDLQEFVAAGVPTFTEASLGVQTAEYQGVSEEVLAESIFSLLDWAEMNLLQETSGKKRRFVRAALVLAGAQEDSSNGMYQAWLKNIWILIQNNHEWTGKQWLQKLINMNGRGLKSGEGMRLSPMWKQGYLGWSLQMHPHVSSEELQELTPQMQDVQSANMQLPLIKGKNSQLYVWSPKKNSWEATVSDNKPILAGQSINMICRCAYALGRGADDMDYYFAFGQKPSSTKKCPFYKPYFEVRH